MTNDIQFDYTKANNLLNKINEFESALHNYIAKLDGDVAGVGTWWAGASYGEYQNIFTKSGGGKTTLEQIADGASTLSSYVVKAAGAKRDWERKGKEYF